MTAFDDSDLEAIPSHFDLAFDPNFQPGDVHSDLSDPERAFNSNSSVHEGTILGADGDDMRYVETDSASAGIDDVLRYTPTASVSDSQPSEAGGSNADSQAVSRVCPKTLHPLMLEFWAVPARKR